MVVQMPAASASRKSLSWVITTKTSGRARCGAFVWGRRVRGSVGGGVVLTVVGAGAGEGVTGHLQQGFGESLAVVGALEFLLGAVGVGAAPLAVHDCFEAVQHDGAVEAVEAEPEPSASFGGATSRRVRGFGDRDGLAAYGAGEFVRCHSFGVFEQPRRGAGR